MKALILILSLNYSPSDSVTEWKDIRVLVGAADTVWQVGQVLKVNGGLSVQYRSNGAVIQRREIYYKKD